MAFISYLFKRVLSIEENRDYIKLTSSKYCPNTISKLIKVKKNIDQVLNVFYPINHKKSL